MDLVQHFYQVSRGWQFKLNGKSKSHPLTHSGGIVFCRAKTPIRIVRRLAQKLAERGKALKDGRKESQFDYLVLESIDYPAEQSLDAFFRTRYGDIAALRRPLRPFRPGGGKVLRSRVAIDPVTGTVATPSSTRKPWFRSAESSGCGSRWIGSTEATSRRC